MSPPAEPTLRTFVALELDAAVHAAVADYLSTWRSMPGVAWARRENLHLTLKFLGNVATTRLPALTERLAAATATLPAFVMRVAGVGAFPNLARPRILWVGCEAAPLAALASAVDTACVQAEFAPEERAFHPHVTLGRIREPGRRDRFPFLATDGGREFGSSTVSAIVLFASKLGSGGARYTPLASLPLAAA